MVRAERAHICRLRIMAGVLLPVRRLVMVIWFTSTPASRIFAVFIVLLGYTLFSVVTASIAALLVGEDEKRIKREMHVEMRALRTEISNLREELRDSFSSPHEAAGTVDTD